MASNPDSRPLPWDQRQRFRFIEALAIWRGRLRAADLRDCFDMSVARADREFALYARMAPGNLKRYAETGEYRPTDQFEPRFLRGTASEYLQILRNHEFDEDLPLAMATSGVGAVECLELPQREFDVRVLAKINAAIREHRWLQVDYQSMSHPAPRRLRIAPHVLVFAGRWHARAWSEHHGAYRDFLLSRISGKVDLEGDCDRDSNKDWDWNNDVAVRIAPHPDLSAAQKAVVEQDFGMTHGMLETRVRVALVPYFLRLLGVARGDQQRPASEQQIVLLNPSDLDALNRLS